MLNLKNIVLVFLITTFICTTAYADIQQTDDLNEIKKAIFKSDKDTLVIFDIDYVIIKPTHAYLENMNDNDSKFTKTKNMSDSDGEFIRDIIKELKSNHSEQELHELLSINNLTIQFEAATPQTIRIFNAIKDKGYKVIALTAAGTGRFGRIPSLEDMRLQELTRLGFVFDHSFKNAAPQELEKHIHYSRPEPLVLRSSPLFKDGILFSCVIPKGVILEAYFDYAKIKPTKIIFVDDKLHNIDSMAEYCKRANIEFLGFEYTAVTNIKAPFNRKRTRLQFSVLKEAKVWLSNVQADKILKDLSSVDF